MGDVMKKEWKIYILLVLVPISMMPGLFFAVWLTSIFGNAVWILPVGITLMFWPPMPVLWKYGKLNQKGGEIR